MIILKLPKIPKCPLCKKGIFAFRDKPSVKEFSLSGICQQCQDKSFTMQDTNRLNYLKKGGKHGQNSRRIIRRRHKRFS